MAKFLTTRGTIFAIEQIINNAQQSIVLLSPFVKIPDSLFQNLMAADKRGVTIELIHGKNRLQQAVLEQLKRISNLKIYFLENVHAKCYFNEQSMVITSLNLYDFSEQSNREMGVYITREKEEEVYKEAVREAQMIMSLAKLENVNKITRDHSVIKTRKAKKEPEGGFGSNILRGFSDIVMDVVGLGRGYCIGCGTRIEYNDERPYCPECYKQWSKNKSQRATHCHSCGNITSTSIRTPLCKPCYKRELI